MSLRIVALLIVLLVSGCAYNTTLRDYDAGSRSAPTFKNKSVAIVIDKSRIQDGHTTSTDVYSFTFNDVTMGVTEALQKRVSLSAQKVDVVKLEDLKAGSYQILIYPGVQARSVHDFWTMGCLIIYRLEIQSVKEHKILADESGEGKRNFFSSHQFDKKCKDAMSEVFIKVTDRAFDLVR